MAIYYFRNSIRAVRIVKMMIYNVVNVVKTAMKLHERLELINDVNKS